MPFLSDLIEANWTLHGCHWLPPGTRQVGGRPMTAENCTETTAHSWKYACTPFRRRFKGRQRLEADVQLVGNLPYDTATEKQHACNENCALNDQHPFPDWSELELHHQNYEGAHDWAKYGAKTTDQGHEHNFA